MLSRLYSKYASSKILMSRPALPESKMSSFSGGQSQKLLLAREILARMLKYF